MFGFMSTSKIEKEAKKFVDPREKEKYLLVIHIFEHVVPPRFLQHEHGFVDLNR